jgi:hypothetical protein
MLKIKMVNSILIKNDTGGDPPYRGSEKTTRVEPHHVTEC